MKSNFKRLLGLLLTILMIVTMVPVTFADVTTSGKFTISGTEFILTGDSKTVGSTTYYGVLATSSRKAGGWGHYRPYLEYQTNKKAGDSGDILVKLYMNNDYSGTPTSNPNSITDVQTYVTYFDAFDGYLIPSTTEWVLSAANSAKLYYTGSVGIPTTAQVTNLYNNGDALVPVPVKVLL